MRKKKGSQINSQSGKPYLVFFDTFAANRRKKKKRNRKKKIISFAGWFGLVRHKIKYTFGRFLS